MAMFVKSEGALQNSAIEISIFTFSRRFVWTVNDIMQVSWMMKPAAHQDYLAIGITGLIRWMDELGFYVPSTVFQSFRDDGRVNMKGSVQ